MTNIENKKEDREAFVKWWGGEPKEYSLTMTQEEKLDMWVWAAWQAAKSHYLSERNECVEEIRRLREALNKLNKFRFCDGNADHLAIIEKSLIVTSPTIERLLKESKS
jgi:hypothetical protein